MANRGSWFNAGPDTRFHHGPAQRFWYRYGRAGLFRASDLNPLGWLAVLGPGIVVGTIAALATDRSLWLLVLFGMAGSWLIALALDTRAWRKIPSGIGLPHQDRQTAEAMVERLRERGIDVELEEDIDAEGGQPAFSLRSTNRFMETIRAEIAAGQKR